MGEIPINTFMFLPESAVIEYGLAVDTPTADPVGAPNGGHPEGGRKLEMPYRGRMIIAAFAAGAESHPHTEVPVEKKHDHRQGDADALHANRLRSANECWNT